MLPPEPDHKGVSPRELKERLKGGDAPFLLDVREPWEFALARIEGARLVPMSGFPDHLDELDPDAETVVICHHGLRSAAVTRFLDRSGFRAVYNLEGGLDAYAAVDGTVPRY